MGTRVGAWGKDAADDGIELSGRGNRGGMTPSQDVLRDLLMSLCR